MTEELIKQKSVELINKLNDKFDKCKWKKCAVSVSATVGEPCFVLKFDSGGDVQISLDTIWVVSSGDGIISKYKATAENGVAHTLAVLWGKVHKSIQEPIDAQVQKIITELDNL